MSQYSETTEDLYALLISLDSPAIWMELSRALDYKTYSFTGILKNVDDELQEFVRQVVNDQLIGVTVHRTMNTIDRMNIPDVMPLPYCLRS